jgi:signal transduction histidine kinase
MLRRKVISRTAALAEANARLSAEIGERAKAQAELDRALVAERELSELRSRFVALVSHEFRTPLGITMSAVELLRHYADRLPAEKLKELHNDIHGATLRMSALMEQVLVLGRVEAGKVPFNAVPINLEILGARLGDEIHSATNGRCRINFRAINDLAGARADEGLLRHILSNLISNAVKYSPEGTPVEFSIERGGDSAVFIVRDQGIGIPEVDQARLFEAFHRASNVGEAPGTGLGLLIVKRCVEMHRGNLTFRSSAGEGTTFVVSIPLFADSEE